MWGWQTLKKAGRAVSSGQTQQQLGLQSPHLPAAITRVGRFTYGFLGGGIVVLWYSGYVNMRTPPGSGPKLVLPGKPITGKPDRPDKGTNLGGQTSGGGANAPGGFLGAVGGFLPASGRAGGFLPRNALYKPGRNDQGRDGNTDPGGAIIAPGAGTVLRVASDPHGFGPAYPIVRFTSGPYTGRIIYIGHTISQLKAGQTFRAGQILSYTGGKQYPEPIGNATVPGWFEIGFADSGSPGKWGQPTPF